MPIAAAMFRAARSAHSALAVAPKSSSTPSATCTVGALSIEFDGLPARHPPQRNRERRAVAIQVLEAAVVAEHPHRGTNRRVDPAAGHAGRARTRRRKASANNAETVVVCPAFAFTRASSESSRKRLHAASIASISAVSSTRAVSNEHGVVDHERGRRAERRKRERLPHRLRTRPTPPAPASTGSSAPSSGSPGSCVCTGAVTGVVAGGAQRIAATVVIGLGGLWSRGRSPAPSRPVRLF